MILALRTPALLGLLYSTPATSPVENVRLEQHEKPTPGTRLRTGVLQKHPANG
jgi:hypothetical protein